MPGNRKGMDRIELEKFDLDLRRLRRPREACVNRMRESMKTQGQLTPVIATPSHDKFLLIDGFKRHRAAESMTWPVLEAILIDVDARRAKAMVYLLNRSGGFSMIQEAVLIKELVELDGLTQNEAALMLNRHKSWISRRLDIIRRLLPEIVSDLLLEPNLPGVGPSLARIPLCNQADFFTSIRVNQLAANEIRCLADLYCKASDPAIKGFILQSPKEALEGLDKEFSHPGTRWPEKIRLLLRIIGTLENDLNQKKQRIRQTTVERIETDMAQIKTILSQILTIIEKEKTWENG
jgi:ParB/RepB/Spo0J family partition protein